MLRLLFILLLFAWPKPHTREDWRYDVATNIWQATTGDWDTAGNWSLGIKPTLNDVVVFDGNISQQSVTTGHTNETGVNVGNIWIKDSYRGDIGTAANPLSIGANASGFTLMRGRGACHISRTGLHICDSPNVLNALSMYGAAASVIVKRGKCIATASHSAAAMSIDINGGILEVVENSATQHVSGIRMTGGQVICSRDWDTSAANVAVLAGGIWQQLKNGPDAGILVVVAGSTVIWDAPASAGHIPTIHVKEGLLDFNNTGDEKTVGVLNIYGGDVLKGTQVTVTSETDYRKDFPE